MKRKLLLVLAICAFAAGIGFWISQPKRDALFRGKPESQWIKELKYFDDEQAKEWATFGADGVRILARGLQGANHPIGRAYRRFHRTGAGQLPSSVIRILPTAQPDPDRAQRMCIIALLLHLGTNADIALPQVEKALDDEYDEVKSLALCYFTETEQVDAYARLNRIRPSVKKRLLSKFLYQLNSSDWGIRNNAIGTLFYYKEEKDRVAPALVKALADREPHVRIRAAEALNHIAPESAVTNDVIPVAIEILNNPDDQMAYRAATLLGAARQKPQLAVPALIKALEGTNLLVCATAADSLTEYDGPTNILMPAFERAIVATNLPNYRKVQLQKKLKLLKGQQ